MINWKYIIVDRLVRMIFSIFILLYSGFVFSQPGGGPGGGGPGGGQGSDPCLKPNPPPSCANVPIDSDIWILIMAGVSLAVFYIVKYGRKFPEVKS